jgi:hypothetical protein
VLQRNSVDTIFCSKKRQWDESSLTGICRERILYDPSAGHWISFYDKIGRETVRKRRKELPMEQTQQQQIERLDKQPAIPPLPPWPTSAPGPKVTEPPVGQKRLNMRTEQVVELQYDQEQGKSTIRGESGT